MVRQAAKWLGILTAVLMMFIWFQLNGEFGVSAGLDTHLIMLIGSVITGLFVYVAAVKA